MSSSINSLGIKLGNTNCRLACATITEWNSLRVNCLNGINEQFTTKTLFTVKANADYSEGFEYCLANNNAHPSNIVFDALNLNNYTSVCYSDEEFGDIFAKKQEDGKYKLKDKYQPKKIEYKDIEVIAGILAKLIEKVKEQLPEKGPKFQQIVITIPSWAEYEYREKMLKVVEILDLENIDVQLIAQITAAAIAYRHKEGDAANGGILFFYMGARNTEYAIYKFLDGQTPKLLHAGGFLDFGGENFTAKLVEVQMADLKWEKDEKWTAMDNEERRTVYQNVRIAMERIKAQLDCMGSATVVMDLGPTLLERTFTITREQFEIICKNQCQQLESFLSSIFNNFNEEINRIVLVGESTKLYLVQNFFRKYCYNEKIILPMNALAPELASVYGAAIKAAYGTFEKSGNKVPKCLAKAIIPNYVFRKIYGNSPTLPSIQFGQQIPTKSIQIDGNSHTTLTWHEQCGNGNNDKEIIKFKKWSHEKYFWKIDKNGLLQFVRIDNKIWCQKNDDLELDECIKRFKQYQSDVIRVKQEQIEYEKKRKEERRLKAQKRQKELEEKKQRQEEAKKAAEELKNKQKLIEENKNYGTIAEVKVNDKVGGGFKQKKFAILPVEQATEVIAPDSNIADVLFEYKYENKQVNTAIYLIGSWDNWKGKIPMKYSQFTNSFLVVLSLPISKGEYEFYFEIHYRRRNLCFNNDVVDWYLNYKYPRRMRMHEISEINFVELNSTTQIDNQNSSWTKNKDLLEKILKLDSSMDKLVNQMKNKDKLEFANDFIEKITQKYLEIRKALSKQLLINSQEVKTLIDEADRVHIYLKIIFFVLYDWANIEKGSITLKESENAQTIHIAFKDELLKLTMSKEEAIYHFKCTFSYPLLNECRRIGLGETSTEIQQLNAFLNADFPPLVLLYEKRIQISLY